MGFKRYAGRASNSPAVKLTVMAIFLASLIAGGWELLPGFIGHSSGHAAGKDIAHVPSPGDKRMAGADPYAFKGAAYSLPPEALGGDLGRYRLAWLDENRIVASKAKPRHDGSMEYAEYVDAERRHFGACLSGREAWTLLGAAQVGGIRDGEAAAPIFARRCVG